MKAGTTTFCRVALAFAVCFLTLACHTTPRPTAGPIERTHVTELKWEGREKGTIVTTPNYRIYTTIEDEEMRARLGQLMQGALGEYLKLAPSLAASNRPMDCYVFRNRGEWAAFTQARTGADSAIYLRINRGGYTVADWYVAYNIGEQGTYPVAAHEGLHQFVARHFVDRLPPFLEEGLATQFENIDWQGDLPRWDIGTNAARGERLQSAIEGHYLFPLDKLVAMDAGGVVGMEGSKIEAFYAQNWAFVKFCRDAEGGKYRPILELLLRDAATGNLYRAPGVPRSSPLAWNPRGVRPMLEHYFGTDLGTVEKAYLAYVRSIAIRKVAGPRGIDD